MKRLTYLAIAIAFIIGISLTLDACKKENEPDPPDPNQPVYSETGEATVGPAGGTIKVVDASSPINGASIEIPEGALAKEVNIKLELSDNDYSKYGLENLKVVKITPHGLTFNSEATLILPWSSPDQNIGNTVAANLTFDTIDISLLPIKALDTKNHKTHVPIYHLSDYSSFPHFKGFTGDVRIYKNNGHIAITSFIDRSFNEIPPWPSNLPENSIYELIKNRPNNTASDFGYRLYEISESGYYNWVASNNIRIEHEQNPFKVRVYGSPAQKGYHYKNIFTKENLDYDLVIDPWMKGFATVALFDEETYITPGFELDPNKTYVVVSRWIVVKNQPTPYSIWTEWFQNGWYEFKIDDLEEFNEDSNLNQIIDQYEENSSGGSPCPGTPTVTDADGNVYNTVQIGNQCWMKENLNVGTRIDGAQNMSDNEITEKYCYNNDPANCEVYGGLYQWNELMQYLNQEKTQGICPDGWHVPSDNEWKELELFIGMSQAEVEQEGWRGTDEGSKLKSINFWNDNGGGSNSSGFSSLPSGLRGIGLSDYFGRLFQETNYWSSTKGTGGYGGSWSRDLRYDSEKIYRANFGETEGNSVRCLKDDSPSNSPPEAQFSVNPNFGTTETVFEFDASGCTDLEDPVEDLQVRWDWENDGTWDTDWNTNKFENHQYVSENTYTVKLEVKDTEGLTDNTKQNVFVSNNTGGGEPCPGAPTVTDADGNVYNTVQIGNQCWMKENLNVGTRIDGGQEMTDNNIIEKYCYDDDPANCNIYGALYQWNEMMQYTTQEGVQGICPVGWHLPSDNEWKELEMFLGMSQVEADKTGWRGTDEGKKLKSTNGWNDNGNGTDEVGFSSLPGGDLWLNGHWNALGNTGYWWTTTQLGPTAIFDRYLGSGKDQIVRYQDSKGYGFSVRCIKD